MRRVRPVHLHHVQPEPGDSLHKSQEGCLIRQHGAHGSRAAADGHLVALEFRSHHRTGLTCESNLIRLGLHKDHASKSRGLSCRQHAGRLEPRHHLREGEPGHVPPYRDLGPFQPGFMGRPLIPLKISTRTARRPHRSCARRALKWLSAMSKTLQRRGRAARLTSTSTTTTARAPTARTWPRRPSPEPTGPLDPAAWGGWESLGGVGNCDRTCHGGQHNSRA